MAHTVESGMAAAHPAALAAQAPGRPTSRWLRLKPGQLALALSVLALTGHAAVWGWSTPWGTWWAMGGALSALAAGCLVWAWSALRREPWVVSPQPQPRVLVDEGPYRFTRNPMALGTAGLMVGAGLAWGVPFMALAAAALLAIQNQLHIPFEEAQLQRAFGGWYSDYAASVRRWL